jgi:hypothetical protein
VVLEPLRGGTPPKVSGYRKNGDDGPTVIEWFKSLLGGNPCDVNGDEIVAIELPKGKGFVFTQQPGETVFVPWGWQHAVLNLSDDLAGEGVCGNPTIAVTHNFIPKRSIVQAERFLEAARAECDRWTPTEFAAVEASVRYSMSRVGVWP